MNTVIALDAMGGDHGPRVVVPAAVRVVQQHDHVQLILVGDETELLSYLQKHPKLLSERRIVVHHASETVEMSESPSLALRGKKDSSMRVAINLVKEGVAHACVSAGNTGALMATARFVLKTLPGIDRPAIISAFPTMKGSLVYMLDLGANVDSSPEHLFQFAVMGSILYKAVGLSDSPRVSLLNIGEEENKGNDIVKKTAALLRATDAVNFVGFTEGDDIFKGTSDVVVCDGFVGNIALKSIEGTAKEVGRLVRLAFKRTWLSRVAAVMAAPSLLWVKKQMDPARYNGATLLGLQGIVIKSHGSATIPGFIHAIEEAVVEVDKNVPEQIHAEVARYLASDQPPAA